MSTGMISRSASPSVIPATPAMPATRPACSRATATPRKAGRRPLTQVRAMPAAVSVASWCSISGRPRQSSNALSRPMRRDWPPASTTPMHGRASVPVGMVAGTLDCRGAFGLAVFLAQRTAFAPGTVAVDVMLLLPDRRFVLERLDGQPAGVEGFVAMRRTRGDHDRQIAQVQVAFRVADPELERGADFGARAFADVAKWLQRHRAAHVVAEAGDGSPEVMPQR